MCGIHMSGDSAYLLDINAVTQFASFLHKSNSRIKQRYSLFDPKESWPNVSPAQTHRI